MKTTWINSSEMKWVGGPVQIHDYRFVWWYRLWLWIKFKVFRRPIGFWSSRTVQFPTPKDPCDYDAMVIDYRPKHMKHPHCSAMENNPPR